MLKAAHELATINARSIKFGFCNKDKQGILMQQSALKKLYPFECYEIKRDVTVINRNPGDPCPTVVDSNRQVGANLLFGPRFVGDFYGQGQSQNPLQGFRSWGGGLGTPGVGLLRGFNLGVPIGSKVLNTDCNYAPQQAPMQTTNTRNRDFRRIRIFEEMGRSRNKDTTGTRSGSDLDPVGPAMSDPDPTIAVARSESGSEIRDRELK
uniref:Uncharacterized protein n=1 Tax=Romanomermis culicivorax TaxID=13658 RepID=A0A915JNF8_ROMCU